MLLNESTFQHEVSEDFQMSPSLPAEGAFKTSRRLEDRVALGYITHE